jgi:surface-anchored protein
MKSLLRLLLVAGLGLLAPARAELAPGFVEVDDIHADIAIPYIGDASIGTWQAFVYTGTTRYAGIYAPDMALFMVNENTLIPRPAAAEFDFIGVAAGAPIYRLAASPVPGQLYLGVEADYGMTSPERMLLNNDDNYKRWDPDGAGPTATQRWVAIAVKAVRGPGHVAVYNFPSFTPRAWVASADGIDGADQFHQIPRSHSHYNWVFTAPGYYEIDIQARTIMGPDSGPGTEVISPVVTFHFQVGPRPKLRIFREGADIVLAWPDPAPGFKLQATPALAPAAWTDVTTTPAIIGGEKRIHWGAAIGQYFFRLHKP